MLKGQNGVTLVALVVTIIVLIILAGVSIAMVLGDNGVVTQAKEAANQTYAQSVEENKEMKNLIEYIQDKTE